MVDQVEQGSWLKRTFRPDTPNGKAAILSAILFLITPALAFFVSQFFLLLLIPGVALALMGLRSAAASGESEPRKLARTGSVIAFLGVMLILGLFIVGVVTDFVMGGERDLRTETVAIGFTTVHILLGLGLLLVDHHRHVKEE